MDPDGEEESQDFRAENFAERMETEPDFRAQVKAKALVRQIGQELAAKREELGMTQKEVARRLGITPSTIARLERGEIDPKLSLPTRFAGVLGQKLVVSLQDKKPA